MEITEEIALGVVELQEDKTETLLKDALDQGVEPQVLLDGVMAGLEEVGRKFEGGEYFMLELMQAGEIGKKLIATITPHLPEREGGEQGKVVIGSTKGDIHDIGKHLVITQLELAGFEVFDLGVDVPAMTFIDKARETEADIIGQSAFMTTTMSSFSEVIDYLKDMGLRKEYKVIVGGGVTDEAFAESIGADGTAPDAVRAVQLCQDLMAQKKGG